MIAMSKFNLIDVVESQFGGKHWAMSTVCERRLEGWEARERL